MAGEDDEVIINLSGDTSTPDVKVAKVEPVGSVVESFNDDDADPIADLKSQFGKMTGRLQNVVAAQEQTVQQLQDTQQRLQRAESQVVTSQIETIEGGIAQLDADAEAAEQAYARAFEAGDGAGMARATRAMQRAETQRSELVQARDAMKRDPKVSPSQQQGRTQPQRQAPQDPVEAAAAVMTPKSAAWIRAHPECITDPSLNKKMLAAHHRALADEIDVDSPEYFSRIEEGIKMTKKADPKPADTGKGDGRRPSSAAASGTGAGGGMNGGSVQVKLTAGEARSATDGTLVWNYDDPSGQNKFKKGDVIGLAEMARRKYEGQKLGLYDKNSFEA